MGFLSLLPLLLPFACFKAGRKSWNFLVPSFLFASKSPSHHKAATAQGPQARLRWQLCLLLHSQAFPAGSLPRQCSLLLAGSSREPLAPRQELPLQLPPCLQPGIPPPFPEIQYISILKHYATLYVCVAGKKLLSDTHWCY